MSHTCPWSSRKCPVVFPRSDSFPPPEVLQSLAPVLGVMVDAARSYDDAADHGELSTAVEFVQWLALNLGARGAA